MNTYNSYRRVKTFTWIRTLCLMFSMAPITSHARIETIAITGATAPGTSGVYSTVGTPTLNASGQVAFLGTLLTGANGVTSSNNKGIWSGSPGSIQLAARKGSSAPGTSGRFITLIPPVINASGQLAFFAGMEHRYGVTPSNDLGIWTGAPGSLQLVVREGTAAPGTTGVFTHFSTHVTFNDTGQIAFNGTLLNDTGGVNPSNDSGLWSGSKDSVQLVAREGSPAPGTSGVYDYITNPLINASGQIAFKSTLLVDTGAVTTSDDVGLWFGSPDSMQLLIREGMEAPGTLGIYEDFFSVTINNAGQVAYKGYLLPGIGEVTTPDNGGVWSGLPDSLELIMREGAVAPGTTGEYSSIFRPAFNTSGQVAFGGYLWKGVGEVTSDDDKGVWFGTPGALQLVARENSPAPGTTGVFDLLDSFPVVNDGGQVAFVSSLKNNIGAVTSTNNRGLWIFGPNGEGLLTVRKGDTHEDRTITGVNIKDASLNRFSQIAYRATYSNGDNGVFLFTPELHWKENSGAWDTPSQWTISQLPGPVHDVSINPTSPSIITGPADNVTLRNLTFGDNPTQTIFKPIPDATLNVIDTLTTHPNLVIDLASFQSLNPAPLDTYRIASFNAHIGNFNQPRNQQLNNGLLLIPILSQHAYDLIATLPGDFDLNGQIDVADLSIWASGFGATSNRFQDGDANLDGQVDVVDLSIWATRFGQTSQNFTAPLITSLSFAQSIPEPATLCLLAFGALANLRRKTRPRIQNQQVA